MINCLLFWLLFFWLRFLFEFWFIYFFKRFFWLFWLLFELFHLTFVWLVFFIWLTKKMFRLCLNQGFWPYHMNESFNSKRLVVRKAAPAEPPSTVDRASWGAGMRPNTSRKDGKGAGLWQPNQGSAWCCSFSRRLPWYAIKEQDGVLDSRNYPRNRGWNIDTEGFCEVHF